ncbi:MAG TPA: hypothetical protein VLN45_12965 [Ignavibacteriaceae bacterium]|nr:hypothetical protein [Ignavibacteriaceae bacterium]
MIYTDLKNHNSSKTGFFTAKLKKHLQNIQHIDRLEQEKNDYEYLKFGWTSLKLNDIPSENIFKISLTTHLNKAPPYFS